MSGIQERPSRKNQSAKPTYQAGSSTKLVNNVGTNANGFSRNENGRSREVEHNEPHSV